MKKNIYMLLNDVSTDTSGYSDTELDEAQLRKYRGNLRKQLGRKKRKRIYAALMAAACVMLVAGLMVLRPLKQRMRASAARGKFSISSLVGTSARLNQMALHIDKTLRIEDGYVTLNAAAIDDGHILIYSTYVFDDAEAVPRLSNGDWGRDYDSPFRCMSGILSVPVTDSMNMNPYHLDWDYKDEPVYVQRMFINGEEICCDITAETYADEKGVVQDCAQYNFHTDTLDYPAQVRIEVYRYSQQLFTSDAKKAETLAEIEPSAAFEFTFTKDMIVENEKDIPLNETIILPDGQELYITRFVYNAMGMRLYGRFPKKFDEEHLSGRICLESVEQMAKSDIFYMIQISDTEVFFTPVASNFMYSVVPKLKQWEFKVVVYQWNGDRTERDRIVLPDRFTIPLK
ncbi:DUF4179 domain-containing protein [Roseburia hominis]